jgi:hypothetical protein
MKRLLLSLACLLTSCDAHGSTFPGVFILANDLKTPVAVGASEAPVPVGTQPVVEATLPPADVIPATAPPTAVGGGSGGGGSGGAAGPPPAVDGAYVQDASGRKVPLPASGPLQVPSGLAAPLILVIPGSVPATLDLPGGVLLHPTAATLPGPASTVARLSGQVSPAEPDLVVQYLSPGRVEVPQTITGADGTFALEVPLLAAEQGLLVVRDAGSRPRLAALRVAIAPDSQLGGLAPALTSPSVFHVLGDSQGLPEALPDPPAQLEYESCSLQAIETLADRKWRAPLLSSRSIGLAEYTLPGFELVRSYRALSPDGLQGATADAGAGEFLAPPDAGAIALPHPGEHIRFPGVPGAKLYTLTLYAPNVPRPPIWEAVTLQPDLVLPAAVGEVLPGSELRIDAWDAPGVTPYTLAGLQTGPRRLRVPSQPFDAGARRSWTIRRF